MYTSCLTLAVSLTPRGSIYKGFSLNFHTWSRQNRWQNPALFFAFSENTQRTCGHIILIFCGGCGQWHYFLKATPTAVLFFFFTQKSQQNTHCQMCLALCQNLVHELLWPIQVNDLPYAQLAIKHNRECVFCYTKCEWGPTFS